MADDGDKIAIVCNYIWILINAKIHTFIFKNKILCWLEDQFLTLH